MEKPKTKLFEPISPDIERIGKIILDAAYKVHTALGPGLLESVYEACLAYEIRQSGALVETQVQLPMVYEGIQVDPGLRLDMLVEKCVVAEIKANVLHLRDGIKRMVL